MACQRFSSPFQEAVATVESRSPEAAAEGTAEKAAESTDSGHISLASRKIFTFFCCPTGRRERKTFFDLEVAEQSAVPGLA